MKELTIRLYVCPKSTHLVLALSLVLKRSILIHNNCVWLLVLQVGLIGKDGEDWISPMVNM